MTSKLSAAEQQLRILQYTQGWESMNWQGVGG